MVYFKLRGRKNPFCPELSMPRGDAGTPLQKAGGFKLASWRSHGAALRKTEFTICQGCFYLLYFGGMGVFFKYLLKRADICFAG